MRVIGQPLALNGKVCVRGVSRRTETVLEYIPGRDQWVELPPPPVECFTIATLRGQLLVVGGLDKSNNKTTNTILTFDEQTQEWVQSYPPMPTKLAEVIAVGYQDHLIVASGKNSESNSVARVNVLDTTTNEWRMAEPLPYLGTYHAVLTEDNIYLVGQYTQTVLRAHVPTLISGAESGGWECLSEAPHYWACPIAIGNSLLTVGGSDKPRDGDPTASIQLYRAVSNRWSKVGDLPEPIEYPCCVTVNSELVVLGSVYVNSVCISTLAVMYHLR